MRSCPALSPASEGLTAWVRDQDLSPYLDTAAFIADESVRGQIPRYGCARHRAACFISIKRHPRQEWCSVACGNRARAARHYQQHR